MMMTEEVVDKKGTFLMLESDRYSFVQRVCSLSVNPQNLISEKNYKS